MKLKKIMIPQTLDIFIFNKHKYNDKNQHIFINIVEWFYSFLKYINPQYKHHKFNIGTSVRNSMYRCAIYTWINDSYKINQQNLISNMFSILKNKVNIAKPTKIDYNEDNCLDINLDNIFDYKINKIVKYYLISKDRSYVFKIKLPEIMYNLYYVYGIANNFTTKLILPNNQTNIIISQVNHEEITKRLIEEALQLLNCECHPKVDILMLFTNWSDLEDQDYYKVLMNCNYFLKDAVLLKKHIRYYIDDKIEKAHANLRLVHLSNKFKPNNLLKSFVDNMQSSINS